MISMTSVNDNFISHVGHIYHNLAWWTLRAGGGTCNACAQINVGVQMGVYHHHHAPHIAACATLLLAGVTVWPLRSPTGRVS